MEIKTEREITWNHITETLDGTKLIQWRKSNINEWVSVKSLFKEAEKLRDRFPEEYATLREFFKQGKLSLDNKGEKVSRQ